MKTTSQQRDEALTILCDVLETLAQQKPSATAKVFIDRARSGIAFGCDAENVIRNVKIAQSYVLPKGVIV